MTSPVLSRVLALVAIIATGGLVLYFLGPSDKVDPAKPEANPGIADDVAPNPRLAFETPYRNVHPDVKYAGDAACALCHLEECESFHQQAMGRSAATWAKSAKRSPRSAPEPGARKELDIAAHLSPNEAVSLREWFDRETR